MTREEVTKYLNILLASRCWDCRYERAGNKVCDEKCVFKQAVNEAIEALQQIICKDCRHKYEEGDCTHYYWCRLHDRPVDDDNYCCWAERRDP